MHIIIPMERDAHILHNTAHGHNATTRVQGTTLKTGTGSGCSGHPKNYWSTVSYELSIPRRHRHLNLASQSLCERDIQSVMYHQIPPPSLSLHVHVKGAGNKELLQPQTGSICGAAGGECTGLWIVSVLRQVRVKRFPDSEISTERSAWKGWKIDSVS